MLATWGLWSLLIVVMFVTYARLDPAELYHVTGDGVAGGLSRVLVAINFPIAIIAIVLVLVVFDRLPSWGWWIGGPAIVLCAMTAVPGVVDDQDLDARWINLVPAIGVVLAAGLTVLAAWQPGRSAGFTARLPLDTLRWWLAAVAVVLSVPWILAELGVYGPGWVFIMERPITGSDGAVNPAVHLGHHHGLDGALFLVSAAVLSRAASDRRVCGPPRWPTSRWCSPTALSTSPRTPGTSNSSSVAGSTPRSRTPSTRRSSRSGS